MKQFIEGWCFCTFFLITDSGKALCLKVHSRIHRHSHSEVVKQCYLLYVAIPQTQNRHIYYITKERKYKALSALGCVMTSLCKYLFAGVRYCLGKHPEPFGSLGCVSLWHQKQNQIVHREPFSIGWLPSNGKTEFPKVYI